MGKRQVHDANGIIVLSLPFFLVFHYMLHSSSLRFSTYAYSFESFYPFVIWFIFGYISFAFGIQFIGLGLFLFGCDLYYGFAW